MSLPHWSYVAMLAFCLAGTLPLVVFYRLPVFRQPVQLASAVVGAGLPFLAWDVAATHAGQWRFDPAQTLPWRLLGLPVEEVAFFLVIPLAAIITYEAVQTVRTNRTVKRPAPHRHTGTLISTPPTPPAAPTAETDHGRRR